MTIPSSSFTFASATPSQLSQAYLIHCQHQYQPWSKSQFEQSNCGLYTTVVGIKDSLVVAYLITQVIVDEVTIIDVAVDTQHRKQGIAERLLLNLFASFAGKPIHQYLLEVRASNLAAIKLYQKLGFTVEGVRHNYYPCATGREDALLMNKRLTNSN